MWHELGFEVARQLRARRGVRLPGLGTFAMAKSGAPFFFALDAQFQRRYGADDGGRGRDRLGRGPRAGERVRARGRRARARDANAEVANATLSLSALVTGARARGLLGGGDSRVHDARARRAALRCVVEELGIVARRRAELALELRPLGRLCCVDGAVAPRVGRRVCARPPAVLAPARARDREAVRHAADGLPPGRARGRGRRGRERRARGRAQARGRRAPEGRRRAAPRRRRRRQPRAAHGRGARRATGGARGGDGAELGHRDAPEADARRADAAAAALRRKLVGRLGVGALRAARGACCASPTPTATAA